MTDRDLAIAAAQVLIDSWADSRAAGGTVGSRAVVDLRAEELIEILLSRFRGAVHKPSLVASLNSGADPLDPHVLAAVPDAHVPVLVMRTILHRHKVMFSPKNVTNWPAFVAGPGQHP